MAYLICLSLLCLVLHTAIQIEISKDFFNEFPDYGYVRTKKDSLRNRFLNKKEEQHKTNLKIKLLRSMTFNDSIYADGVLYNIHNDANVNASIIKHFDDAFRNIVTMKGVTYIYKRDYFWRTWREIKEKENRSVVYYRLQNLINKSCPKCMSSGYWVIQDFAPRCPYEIISRKSNNDVSIFKHTLDPSIEMDTVITIKKLQELCYDPIETIWLITRDYDTNISESSLTVMCQGRQTCEIITVYNIFPEKIVFSIINSTNHVIYSKIMMDNNITYACVNACGIIDPKTKKMIKTDSPDTFNLLPKKKREPDFHYLKGITDKGTDNKISRNQRNLTFKRKPERIFSNDVTYNYCKIIRDKIEEENRILDYNDDLFS